MNSQDRTTLEQDLEELMSFMAQPPSAGSPDDQRLHQMIDRVEAYKPADKADDPVGAKIASVSGDIEAFRRRRQVERQRHAFGEHAEGIGPTIGVDVSRA